MNAAGVLIIEDDAGTRGVVRKLLDRAGMVVHEAPDGQEGLRTFFEERPDLVILGVDLSRLDGWQVLGRIREMSQVPVLMLTRSNTELNKVRGLRAGADDYVTKPFGDQELLARVEALLRRSRQQGEDSDAYADEFIRIDYSRRQVSVLDKPVTLTPTEFKLLSALTRNVHQVLSHQQLTELIWGDEPHESNQVKLYISYLRRKLREAAAVDPVQTVRGFGYRYRPRRLEGEELP